MLKACLLVFRGVKRMAITDEITRLQIAKSNIKTSIESKGVIVPEEATLDVYAPLIDTIETQGLYQEKSVTPKVEDQVVKPDEGFDALSKVVVEKTPLEEKTVTPSTAGEIVEPSMGKIGMSKVTVMGDMNLTSNNIKKDVTIFGVTGNFEGGESGDEYYRLGTSVSVYARDSFSKGQIFIGEKNPDLLGEIIYDEIGTPSYIRAWNKKNLDIVAFTTTLSTSSTYYAIGLKKEDVNEYERITVDLPSGYVNYTVATNNSNTLINDDGTKIVIPQSGSDAWQFDFSLLIINVNKSAKTASVTRVDQTDFGAPTSEITFEYEGETYTDGRHLWGSPSGGLLIKNYLIILGYISSSSAGVGDGSTPPLPCLIALKESQGGYKFNNIIMVKRDLGYPTRKTFRMTGENDGVGICGKYGLKFHFGEGGVSATVSFEYSKTVSGGYTMNITNLSKNGKYMCAKAANDVGEVYEVDFGSGTYESIYSITNATYCDSSGRYVIAQDGDSKEATLYMNGEVLAEGIKSCEDDYFEFTADEFYVHSNSDVPYICYRNPDDFDYYISNTQAYIEESDRIYGIVPEGMAMGDVGKAQALFNTFTS
jgi:hypothetical protein